MKIRIFIPVTAQHRHFEPKWLHEAKLSYFGSWRVIGGKTKEKIVGIKFSRTRINGLEIRLRHFGRSRVISTDFGAKLTWAVWLETKIPKNRMFNFVVSRLWLAHSKGNSSVKYVNCIQNGVKISIFVFVTARNRHFEPKWLHQWHKASVFLLSQKKNRFVYWIWVLTSSFKRK